MTSDRLKRALQGLIRTTVPEVDYLAFYPARVVAQAADLSLDLIPDDARLPTLQRVPLRLGVPGVEAKVQAGSRVLLFFERGDPSAPACALFQSSVLTELVITAQTKVVVSAPAVDLGGTSPTIGPVLRSGDNVLIAALGPTPTSITVVAPTPPLLPTKVKA